MSEPRRSESGPPGVVVLHNRYLIPGGEDQVFAAEADLLEAHGHPVTRHVVDNEAIADRSRLALAVDTVWSRRSYRDLRRLFRDSGARIAHFHNILPQISPAAYYAARAEGLAVVQTLHNYRLACPAATLMREGRVCEDCLGRPVAWAGMRHGCYRGSRTATGAVAAMLAAHRALGTWHKLVDLYIALSDFARDKHIQAGLPAGRIAVKPNFLAQDRGPGSGGGGFVLFIGRLSPEKGLRPLLDAWRAEPLPWPLHIYGDGPLAAEVAAAAAATAQIRWFGWQPADRIAEALRRAEALVLPSLWFEGFPMTMVEAYAAGLPVIASRIGSLAELVAEGRTGLLVPPGDAPALSAAVRKLAADAGGQAMLAAGARRAFETRYTAQRNYEELAALYGRVLGRAALARRKAA